MDDKPQTAKSTKSVIIFLAVVFGLLACFIAFSVIGCNAGWFEHEEERSDDEKQNIANMALLHDTFPEVWEKFEYKVSESAVQPDSADSYIVIHEPFMEAEYVEESDEELNEESAEQDDGDFITWNTYPYCDFDKLELASHKGADDEWTEEDMKSLDFIVSYYSDYKSAYYSVDGKDDGKNHSRRFESQTVTIAYFDAKTQKVFHVDTLGGRALPDKIQSNESDYLVSQEEIDNTINDVIEKIKIGTKID